MHIQYLDVTVPVKIFITGTGDNITVNVCVRDESWTLDARFPNHKTWSQVDSYRHLGDRIQFVFDDKSVWTLVVRIKPEVE